MQTPGSGGCTIQLPRGIQLRLPPLLRASGGAGVAAACAKSNELRIELKTSDAMLPTGKSAFIIGVYVMPRWIGITNTL